MAEVENKKIEIKAEIKGIKVRHLNPKEYDEFCDKLEELNEDKRADAVKGRKMVLWFVERYYSVDINNNAYTIFDMQDLFDNTLAMTNQKSEEEIKN